MTVGGDEAFTIAWQAGRATFTGAAAGFHSWASPAAKCSRCGLLFSKWDVVPRCPEAGWLEELCAAFGEPRAVVEDQKTERYGDPCIRWLWLWFVGGHNHLLSVWRFPRRWEIAVEAHAREPVQAVTGRCRSDGRPDELIRVLLGAAGWLE